MCLILSAANHIDVEVRRNASGTAGALGTYLPITVFKKVGDGWPTIGYRKRSLQRV